MPLDNHDRYTRRALLETAGSVITAATLCAGSALAADSPGPLITAVSNYMSEAGTRPLPAPVIEKAKQMILDTFAAMISGSELPPGRFAVNFARAYRVEGSGEAVSTVAGSN